MANIYTGVLAAALLVACGPQAPGGSGEGTAVTTGSAETAGPAETTAAPTTSGTGSGGSGGLPGDPSSGPGGGSSGPGGDGGTSAGGSSGGVGGSTTEGQSSGEQAASEGSSGSSGEPTMLGCPDSDWDENCPPVDCMKQSCGELLSRHDAQGVRWKSCDAVTCCEPGFGCFRPFDWGGCVPSVWGCGFATEDCGGAYCVPEALKPPPVACGGTDEASCVASGCSFMMAPWFAKTGESCECGEAPLCLWFSEPVTSVEKPTAYYHSDGVNVRLLAQAWSAPPFGYKPCAGDPDAPAGCGCVDSCVP